MATAYKYQDEVFTTHGDVVPFATITVYNAGTSTLSTLYANTTSTVALANPVTADYQGFFYFYAALGTYDITIAGTGITSRTLTDIWLGGNASGDPSELLVDGTTYTTIQSAITSAGTTKNVRIPASYAGTDTYTNPNKIQIDDKRIPASRQRGYVNMLTDCGLKGDGVTDDYAAAQACLNAYPQATFFFPPTKTDGSCSYMFNSTLKPTGEGTTIAGAGSGYKNSATLQGGTVLCWAAGVTGIELDLTGANCSGCNIRDISLVGSEGTAHLVTPTLLNMPSGASLTMFKRNISAIQRTANVLTVTTSLIGAEGLTQQVGSQVLIAGVVGDATMNGRCIISTLGTLGGGSTNNPTSFTCAQNGADAGPFGAVGTVTLPTTGASTADGIRICTNFATIKHVAVSNFGRHGINADSSAAVGMCPTNFSDDLIIRDSFLVGNQGNGYLCRGTDCNVHLLSGNAVYYNVLWGLEDHSSLGNTHIANQLSNGGHLWASGTTPATKAISSISRTLVSGVSTVTVVLSVADTNLKLGSGVVIAGVTDASFNTTAGQCFFITNFTDSTHFQYEQPGAPVDASSSGGTSRMAKFSEAYLSSGVDDGAQKIATQESVAQPVIVGQYVEGGQNCKQGTNTILLGGASLPGCNNPVPEWMGRYFTTQGVTGTGGTLSANIGQLLSDNDSNYQLKFRAGNATAATARDIVFLWNKYDNTTAWSLDAATSGTNGDSAFWLLTRNSVRRFGVWGPSNSGGITRINSESTGAIQLNLDANSGTGGVAFASGGVSPATVATVDSTGLGTFNGGVKAGASGSTIADSRELVQSAHSCGTTTTCANTSNGSNRVIFGSVALASATPSTATVASISPAFTSSSSYFCIGTNTTTQANAVKIANVSSSSFTITGPNTVTDVINYICVGN